MQKFKDPVTFQSERQAAKTLWEDALLHLYGVCDEKCPACDVDPYNFLLDAFEEIRSSDLGFWKTDFAKWTKSWFKGDRGDIVDFGSMVAWIDNVESDCEERKEEILQKCEFIMAENGPGVETNII